MAKEVSVRLHEELERLETKRTKAHDELERTKRLLDESEDRRLSLQKEVNSVTNEVCILVYFHYQASVSRSGEGVLTDDDVHLFVCPSVPNADA